MTPHDDAAPVGDEEWLLRRIPSAQLDFGSDTLRAGALLPLNAATDADGLSMNRERFIGADELLESADNPNLRDYRGVVALRAAWLREEGFDIVPDPAEARGHVLVPKLSAGEYGTAEGKKRIKEAVVRLLARIAAEGALRANPKPKP